MIESSYFKLVTSGENIQVTVSMGVAEMNMAWQNLPEQDYTAPDSRVPMLYKIGTILIQKADSALYEAKKIPGETRSS